MLHLIFSILIANYRLVVISEYFVINNVLQKLFEDIFSLAKVRCDRLKYELEMVAWTKVRLLLSIFKFNYFFL